ncbi:hypothetical protein [Nonomuraea sp. NPDC049141]|uniref:hypothetical protein n=1 Tax=Nonomuraea sp. NPDC049141 TaxID=3155500 RepID=UPI00340D9662
MARKHTMWSASGAGLCGKPVLATGPKDFACNHCQAIQGVMRAVEIGARESGLVVERFPFGNNACRIECDTTTPEFRRFAALMRRGLDLHGSGSLYAFSVRGKTPTEAFIRHSGA